jgi:sphinganine-1-phosphate aldolase
MSPQAMRGAETDFQTGRAFGGIYNDHHELNKIIIAAENIFHDSNGLFPTIFPGLRKMETEVIRMAANLLHGDANVVGSLTTGGTESILCAIKAYREKAEKERGVTHPELIFPDTAHPAFAKACDLFKVKMVILSVRDSDRRVDPKTVKASINGNTIAIVASAPTYPHGVVDPIEEIGSIAEELNIPFHVDACLGGFHLPFLTKLGLYNKKFDFAIPGVTSMTADLHKYGMGPKGTAVLLYAD